MSRVATATPSQQSNPVEVPHEKIAMRAYAKWIKRGQPQGSHLQDWLEAERELQAEYARASSTASRR